MLDSTCTSSRGMILSIKTTILKTFSPVGTTAGRRNISDALDTCNCSGGRWALTLFWPRGCPRGKSANNASKGVCGSREFSGADCRRVAAVIRVALVEVGGCCYCWGRWTCGHSESAGTLKARRRSCRSARTRLSRSTWSLAWRCHFPISSLLLWISCSSFRKCPSSLSLQDGEFDRCISLAIATGKAPCVLGMFNSTTGTVRGALLQSFFHIAGHLKIHLTLSDSDKIIRLWWARLQERYCELLHDPYG